MRLSLQVAYVPPDSQMELLLQDIFDRSKAISDSNAFAQVITLTIIIVGVMIGVETDQLMHCNRREGRMDSQPWHNTSYWKDQDSWCDDGVLLPSKVVSITAQAVFTVEAVFKILSEGWEPLRYFEDAWNKLDFFIVSEGVREGADLFFACLPYYLKSCISSAVSLCTYQLFFSGLRRVR